VPEPTLRYPVTPFADRLRRTVGGSPLRPVSGTGLPLSPGSSAWPPLR
jgi:hypothetical protein